jgi:hypothetical protein
MAPGLVETTSETLRKLPIENWVRPEPTKENLDWAPLSTIDLSRFDEPGGKQELAKQLYDAVKYPRPQH